MHLSVPSAVSEGAWPENLPCETLRDVGVFSLGKKTYSFGNLLATCQCLLEEAELSSFGGGAAARRETVVTKCSCEVQTRG